MSGEIRGMSGEIRGMSGQQIYCDGFVLFDLDCVRGLKIPMSADQGWIHGRRVGVGVTSEC